jgi:hypothetical protein
VVCRKDGSLFSCRSGLLQRRQGSSLSCRSGAAVCRKTAVRFPERFLLQRRQFASCRSGLLQRRQFAFLSGLQQRRQFVFLSILPQRRTAVCFLEWFVSKKDGDGNSVCRKDGSWLSFPRGLPPAKTAVGFPERFAEKTAVCFLERSAAKTAVGFPEQFLAKTAVGFPVGAVCHKDGSSLS